MWSQALPLKWAGMALKAMTKLFWAGSISGSQSVCVCVWFGLKGVVRERVYVSSRVGASKRFKTRWNTSDASCCHSVRFCLSSHLRSTFSNHKPLFFVFPFSGTTSRRRVMSLSAVQCSRRCGRMPLCCPCMRARSWARWRGWTKGHFVPTN